MRYGIFINQAMCMKWGITGKKANAAHVFAILHESHSWAEEIIIGGQVYYWASRNAICDELAYLQLKPDTVYRHLKYLEELGLIDYVKSGKKDCIRITKEGKKWNAKEPVLPSEKLGFKSEPRKYIRKNSDLNPKKPGFKSENDSDLNPTDQSTNIDQNTNDQNTTHKARAIENDPLIFKDSKKEKKESSRAAEIQDPFPHPLMRYLEQPHVPELFWDAFQALTDACHRNNLVVGFEGRYADNQISDAIELFNLLKAHKKIPQDGTGLTREVASFIDTLPEWYRDKFELSLIVKKFTKILNEQKPKKNGNTQRDYAAIADRQRAGEKIYF